MPLTKNSAEDAYRSNIQIADLSALSAVLAVGTWKRLCGFYVDQVQALHLLDQLKRDGQQRGAPMSIKSLTPQFVHSFPQKLEPGEL